MVGFISKSPVQEEQGEPNQDLNPKNFNDPFDFFDPKVEDFSLIDSFLDFDAINWLESHPNLSSTELGFFGRDMEMIPEGSNEETCVPYQITSVSEPIVVKLEPLEDGSEPIVKGSEPSVSGGSQQVGSGSVSLPETKVDGEELKTGEILTLSIEKDLGKVSLAVDGDSVARSEPKSDSESESESSSSSSATSDSGSSDDESDEEEEKEKKEYEEQISLKTVDDVASECEEGEIKNADVEESDGKTREDDEDEDADADAMIAWSDTEEEYDFGANTKEPIRSKNELKDLPPVPRVDIALEPHHAMLPVGVVLSMIETQVIVEGVEKHNPLSEGSILWITETRSPLGIVDEIFGPVKNPYYVVRYNSESEVPARIHQGTMISFVMEFADHVFNHKDLYKKGYDASGENDEEISDEFEFSDDEKEAEYKRMQRMAKRGTNEQKQGGSMKNNKKKMKNKDGRRQINRHTSQQTENRAAQSAQPSNPNQRHILPTTPPLAHGNSQVSPATGQNFTGGNGFTPSFQQMPQAGGFVPNGMPGVPWLLQNNQQQPFPVPMPNPMLMQNRMHMPNPMPMQNLMPVSNPMLFQQQFGPGQVPLPNVVMPGGQRNLNFFAGPSSRPWPPFTGQNGFNSSAFGSMGFHAQPSNGALNPNQGVVPHVANADNSHKPAIGSEAPQQFSVGASTSHGRRPHHRAGGRFGRGRGRQQSR